jgi:hypothetical protein
MTTRRTLCVLPLLAAMSLALGCGGGDSPTETTDQSGTVSFTYSGAVSGSYTATGAIQVTGTVPQYGNFAVGFWEDQWFEVLAHRAGTHPRGDLFTLNVENISGPGSFTIRRDCTNNCAWVELVPNFNWNTFAFERVCELESGSVQVTAINNQRAQGSFSGQGSCYDMADNRQGSFSISNGSFNIPIMRDF